MASENKNHAQSLAEAILAWQPHLSLTAPITAMKPLPKRYAKPIDQDGFAWLNRHQFKPIYLREIHENLILVVTTRCVFVYRTFNVSAGERSDHNHSAACHCGGWQHARIL
jgi:hypothetical protein